MFAAFSLRRRFDGTVLVASAPVEGAEGFGAVPEEYERLELLFIPESDRDSGYGGTYGFSFRFTDIGTTIKRLPRTGITADEIWKRAASRRQ